MKTKSVILVVFFFALILGASCKKKELPVACFDFSSESMDQGNVAIVGESIQFENCSKNADSYFWDFGDGKTSTSLNPRHSYGKSGTYQITLEATNGDGKKSITQEIEIQATLTSKWEGSLELFGEEYGILFDIKQEGTKLSGTFSFDDESGFAELASTSKIIGSDVTINFTESEYGMVFKFTGKVNTSFNKMEGDYTIKYSDTTGDGAWSVSKTDTKSATKSGERKGIDFLLKHLK